ncbi:MAG: FHA domain-containing protein [Pyrobaculum sp.]|jgi:hypothetical protein|nr:FHA domain-containing protein [Pyrobaculum sp.]
MRYLLLLLLAVSAAAAPILAPMITDQSGAAKTSFAPGETIYIYFPSSGTAHVEIVDTATGVVMLEKTIAVETPGLQPLWQLAPDTAEGTYRIYITFNGQPYVYSVAIATPIFWQPYLAVAAAVAAAGYLLWYRRARAVPRPRAFPAYRLQLPNNYVVQINTSQTVFGRSFFVKLGVPEEVAKYISRNHFAIYAEGGRFYIQDMGSKNGTWLNGRPIKGLNPQPLKHGDVITVAQVLSLRFLLAK